MNQQLLSLTKYFQFHIVNYEIDSNVSNPKQWDNLPHDPINGGEKLCFWHFRAIEWIKKRVSIIHLYHLSIEIKVWMEIVHEIEINQSPIEMKLSQFILQMWTQIETIHGNRNMHIGHWSRHSDSKIFYYRILMSIPYPHTVPSLMLPYSDFLFSSDYVPWLERS